MKTAELFQFDKDIGLLVGGMDEAGRGPLAGPVVCACCVMGDHYIEGINDSKKVSEAKREKLFDLIVENAVSYGVGIVENDIIDEINILNATMRGMEAAFADMPFKPELLLVDAVAGLKLGCETRAIIKGDAVSYNIAAASIIAKVTRDRILRSYAEKYPDYGFEKHKGYGTAAHIAAIVRFGPLPVHRKTFIKNFVAVV